MKKSLSTKIIVNLYFAFLFLRCYRCRAKIIKTNPLEVYYIDYGNTETLTSTEGLKACPMELMTLHPSVRVLAWFLVLPGGA